MEKKKEEMWKCVRPPTGESISDHSLGARDFLTHMAIVQKGRDNHSYNAIEY